MGGVAGAEARGFNALGQARASPVDHDDDRIPQPNFRSGRTDGPMELVLQFPPLDGELENSHRFAMRVHGDSMHANGIADDFRPGEVVIFSSASK